MCHVWFSGLCTAVAALVSLVTLWKHRQAVHHLQQHVRSLREKLTAALQHQVSTAVYCNSTAVYYIRLMQKEMRAMQRMHSCLELYVYRGYNASPSACRPLACGMLCACKPPICSEELEQSARASCSHNGTHVAHLTVSSQSQHSLPWQLAGAAHIASIKDACTVCI